MKRIGIDAHMLGDRSGGNETFYSGVLEHLEVPAEYKIYLFVTRQADVALYKDKFCIVYFRSKNAFVRNFIELPFLCLKYKLDLLHTQYFIPFFCPCPVACTIHDICFEHFKDIFTKKEYVRQKILIPYAAKHSDYVYTVSEFSKKDIIEKYRIDGRKVGVVYNATKDIFKPLSPSDLNLPELKKKFGITGQYILSVGNLQPRKNLVRLIKAFVSVKKNLQKRDFQLVIVGKKAWMFNDIINSAMNNNADIIFTDYVIEEELVRLYNGALAFVYPSFFEGFGLPPIEAMACGTPVAVAKKSALPEVVGDAALFFDPFDEKDIEKAFVTLLEDDQLRKELVALGNKRIKLFDWNYSANKIVNGYNEVLGIG